MIKDVTHYWINRDSDKLRKEHMLSWLSQENIQHHRIEAITPETLPQIIVNKNYQNSNSVIELAVVASHIIAIAQAYKNGDEYAVILEDDNSSNYLYDLEAICADAPEDWEILQLQGCNPTLLQRYQELHFLLEINWQRWQLFSWGAGAYLINRQGMKKLLKHITMAKNNQIVIDLRTLHSFQHLVADVVVYDFLRSYTSTLCLFFHDTKFDSTIHNDHVEEHHKPAEEIITQSLEKAKVFYKDKTENGLIPYAIKEIST